jgi:heme-degrading monooxygenase HmoA
MIRHTVVFKLKYPKGSREEQAFLAAAAQLSGISGVHHFETLRQSSTKNDFDYGLSMEFETQEDYEAYNNHPEHTRFVETYWGATVDKFLEIDYEPLNQL